MLQINAIDYPVVAYPFSSNIAIALYLYCTFLPRVIAYLLNAFLDSFF
jgi:hypothetical protein